MAIDYEEYECECERVKEENKPYLEMFEASLEEAGLSNKTIRRHVTNIDFYLNVYLLRYDVHRMPEGTALVPIIIESVGDTYPFGAWDHANKLGTLAALGLIDKSPWASFPILPGRDRKIAIGKETLTVGNVGAEEIPLDFEHVRFLPSGLELATLCDVGTADDLIEAAKMAVREMSPDLLVVED